MASVFFSSSDTGRSKSARMHSTTSTHNWVLNTMVRSWNATLAARPKPSPRTTTKMKVMIQISCKNKATHTVQQTLIRARCRRSRTVRKHELLWTTVEIRIVQGKRPASEVISAGSGSEPQKHKQIFKNPKKVYPLLIPSSSQLRK